MATVQTWTVTLHEVLGSTGNVYFWTPDLTQGAVEVQVKNKKETVCSVYTEDAFIEEFRMPVKQSLNIDIPESSTHIEVALWLIDPDNGDCEVVSKCGIEVEKLRPVLPLEKYFILYRSNNDRGGYVKMDIRQYDDTRCGIYPIPDAESTAGKENIESALPGSHMEDEAFVFLPPQPIYHEFPMPPGKESPSFALDKPDVRTSQEFAIYSENEPRGMNTRQSCDILREDSRHSMVSLVSSTTSTKVPRSCVHGLYDEKSGALLIKGDLASEGHPTVESPHNFSDHKNDTFSHIFPTAADPISQSEQTHEAHEALEVCLPCTSGGIQSHRIEIYSSSCQSEDGDCDNPEANNEGYARDASLDSNTQLNVEGQVGEDHQAQRSQNHRGGAGALIALFAVSLTGLGGMIAQHLLNGADDAAYDCNGSDDDDDALWKGKTTTFHD